MTQPEESEEIPTIFYVLLSLSALFCDWHICFFFPFPIFSSCVEMSFYCYFADKWLPTFGGSITMIDRLHDDDGLQKPILCASK